MCCRLEGYGLPLLESADGEGGSGRWAVREDEKWALGEGGQGRQGLPLQ
jgi:hypothetical protein